MVDMTRHPPAPKPTTAAGAKAETEISAEGSLALAKSRIYQAASDAPATRKAYAADIRAFAAWCAENGFQALPAAAETVGAYLGAKGLGYALPTLRRRVAAIAHAHRQAGHPLDTRHPAIRETLRGIARVHTQETRKAAALVTEDIVALVDTCQNDLRGLRDRALLLVGFAGALRRSELAGLTTADLHIAARAIRITIARSKTDKMGEGAEIWIAAGEKPKTCPVSALKAWLSAAAISEGPIFRGITRHGHIGRQSLNDGSIRGIVVARAALAGLVGTRKEPISAHGLRAGFITTAYANGVSDEEIMGHSRHRDLRTMRGYVRRTKLGNKTPASKVGL
jgi:integrase